MIFKRRRNDQRPALPACLIPPPFAPGATLAVDDTGLLPWYRGYSGAARTVAAFCPYIANTCASLMWHDGAAAFRADQRLKGITYVPRTPWLE